MCHLADIETPHDPYLLSCKVGRNCPCNAVRAANEAQLGGAG